MSMIDLSPFGFARKIGLEGDVVDSSVVVGGSLLFFFEENHACDAAIQSCLRMACHLIDEAIVTMVCVEGYPFGASPCNRLLRDFGSLAGQQGIDPERLIANPVRNTQDQIAFGDTLCVLRPNVEIVGIENPDDHARAGKTLDEYKRNMLDMLADKANKIREGLSSLEELSDSSKRQQIIGEVWADVLKKTDDVMEQHVRAPRDRVFIQNIADLVKPHCPGHAAIVNVGRAHHDATIAGLRARGGCSILRIRPHGLKECDEQQSMDPRYQAIKRIKDQHNHQK